MKALILEAPRKLAFEESADPPLDANEVRIRTLYSGISAGTELTQYRGTNPFMNHRFDEARRLFVEAAAPSWEWPVRNLGYEEVGEIVELGREVTGLALGSHVFGTWNHRTHHVTDAGYARERLMPEHADPRIGIFSHIGAVALNGVHDAQIRIGDTVAVFGFGVPGQIVAQAARASGATVIAVDPDRERRRFALELGADHALEPSAAEAIKDLTGGRGADACIE
ncbi:MAG: zinc-binding alcohol dehydrogenase, partial [Novosphingobium sp.]|nr:zinc-binding alcohol dehydrogenase [Novosphingobium sp.]